MISEFAKEKVFWTRKMNLKLVNFIQNKPNIWNPKHPKYTSVEHRDQTYAEFAAQYGNKFTGYAVKNRWTNIRSTFANYLRKFNASRVKGEDATFFTEELTYAEEDDDNDFSDNFFLNDTNSSYCNTIAESLVNVFKGVQNDAYGLDNTKYARIGRLVAKKLSHMDSYEASKATKRITEILLLYDENNPFNPNNNKT